MPIVQWLGVVALTVDARGSVARVVALMTDAKATALTTYAKGPMQEPTFK